MKMKKLVCLLLVISMVTSLTISCYGAAGDFVYDVSGLSSQQVYSNNFDGKTKADIYADWNGVLQSKRPNPVTADGWLMADWDTTNGVGYSFKSAYMNAKYNFDVKSSATGFNCSVVLRTKTDAGGMYGGISSTDTSAGYGVGFYLYSSAYPNKATIVIADAAMEKLSTSALFPISYPTGVNFTSSTHMTVYDLNDKILYYINNQPFAAIQFNNYNGTYYTSGTVYDGTGAAVGSYTGKRVQRSSNFAMTNRTTQIYMDNLVIEKIAEETNQAVYDYASQNFNEVYSNNFDGKTAAQIYADWNGVLYSSRTNTVTQDGWLTADWDTVNGIGYAFKTALVNAKYDFDVKYAAGGYNCSVVLRTPSEAGGMFGGISSSDTSVGFGVGFYFYSSSYPNKATIVIAGADKEILSKSALFPISYPTGVDFKSSTHMTVYDLDDKILYYINNQPFAAIQFKNYNGTYYTSGTVYDGTGAAVGSYTGKKVQRGSNFAMTNRTTSVFIDNFSIGKNKVNIAGVDEPKASVVYGTSYQDAVHKLPNKLTVTSADSAEALINVAWDEACETYDSGTAGTYEIHGSLSSDIYNIEGQEIVGAMITVLPMTQEITSGETVMYQITPSTVTLMMGYVIKTKTGKLIVIDGGLAGDVANEGFLFETLQDISGQTHPVIDAWFLTHIHDDHTSEFSRILMNHKDDITIKNIYFHFPTNEWYEKSLNACDFGTADQSNLVYLRTAYDNLMGEGAFDAHQGVQVGDMIVVDDVTFDILQTPIGTETNVNDTSMVFRMTADNQTVMFLGDTGVASGNRLADTYGDKLKSDMVQMAHHGQGGVDKNVYELIAPGVCFWPTPDWLWKNAAGTFQTTTVRGWMFDDLNVKHHIVAGLSGTQMITFRITPAVSVNYYGEDKELETFKNEKIYMKAQTTIGDEFKLVSALYKGKKLIQTKIISSAALNGEKTELFDLSQLDEDDYTMYEIKTFSLKDFGSIQPLYKVFSIKGAKIFQTGFDEANAALVYSNTFDDKTAEQIYGEWNGVHAASVTAPVENGWLKATWDPVNGVGYSLKNAYQNAKYTFDIKQDAGGLQSVISLRSTEHAGRLFNDFAQSSDETGDGIGFFIYKSGCGGAAIAVADHYSSILSQLPLYKLEYPQGIDFTVATHMTIYDMDDKILFYVDDTLYAVIALGDLDGDYYTSGTIYSGGGTEIGSFANKKVMRQSNFAIAERTNTTYLDNLMIYQ